MVWVVRLVRMRGESIGTGCPLRGREARQLPLREPDTRETNPDPRVAWE